MNKHFGSTHLLLALCLHFGLPTFAHAASPRDRIVGAWRSCHGWLAGRNPLLTKEEQIFRGLVIKARDPNFRPPWKEYVPNKTSLQAVVDDPEYFYVPANVWNDLLEERFPETAREARDWHQRQDLDSDEPNAEVELPTPAELPEPILKEVKTAWPDDEPYLAGRPVAAPEPPYLSPSAWIEGDAPAIVRQPRATAERGPAAVTPDEGDQI